MTSFRNQLIASFLAGLTFGLPAHARGDSLQLPNLPASTAWVEEAPKLCVGVGRKGLSSWSIGQHRCPASSELEAGPEGGIARLPRLARLFSFSWGEGR